VTKVDFNFKSYHKTVQSSECIFCTLAKHSTAHTEHYVYEDEFAFVVLDRYPTQYGYLLAAPKEHVEEIHLLETEYFLKLQSVIHLAVRGVQMAMGAERVYTACLGTKLLTPHIHYHIVPLPSDLALDDQQWNALDKSRGIIEYSEKQFSSIADRIRTSIQALL